MPSPSERPAVRDPWLFVGDMLAFTETALRYAGAHGPDALEADRMRWDAILRNIELLGEAANQVPADIQLLAPELPWRTLVGVRNRLAHAYLHVEPEVIHRILQVNLPALRVQLQALLQQRRSTLISAGLPAPAKSPTPSLRS